METQTLKTVLTRAVARSQPRPRENMQPQSRELARLRRLTMRLVGQLEKTLRPESAEEEGRPPYPWLFGEKENAVSTLVRLSQNLVRLLEMEQALKRGEDPATHHYQETQAEMEAGDREIIERFMARRHTL